MKHIYILVFCLASLLVTCSADYEIGEKDWESTLAKNQHTFVKFYSPYCGWCQKLAPLWTELSKAFDGALNVVAVDVTVHKALAAQEGVSGVPSMKWYNGKTYLGEYKGPRTQQDIAEWIFARLSPIELEYDSVPWSRYTSSLYSQPIRFLYIYAEGEKPDTTKLFEAVRTRGIFAEAMVPKSKLAQFLSSYNLRSLPALTTAGQGGLSIVRDNNIQSVFDSLVNGNTEKEGDSKSFGGPDSQSSQITDSHSAFTFLFFLIAISGLAYFAWTKLSFPNANRTNKDISKSV